MSRFFLFGYTLCLSLLIGSTACAPPSPIPPEVPQFDAQRGTQTVRVSGHAPALPLIRHLAESFSAAESGVPIEIAPALSGDGSLKALEDGVLDLAVTLEPEGFTEGYIIARTDMVLALGRGIEARSFTLEQLSQFWSGRLNAEGHHGIHLLHGTRNDPLLALVSRHIPEIAKDIARPMIGGRSVVSATPGGLAREAGAQRGAAALALSGNLRMLGIPVWVGTLPREISSIQVVARHRGVHPRVNAFLEYLQSPEGRRVVSNFGFTAGEMP